MDMPCIRLCGDSAISLEFANEISVKTNSLVSAAAGAIEAAGIRGVTDIVPSYRAILVCYDPDLISYKKLTGRISLALTKCGAGFVSRRIVNHIPVCYEGEYAPDMGNVTAHSGLSAGEVIKAHSAPDYLIYMLGFLPGFPYLGGLDPRLYTPRLDTPRTVIERGSVGIGGRQTGIYPLPSPGGWQLIGRTPVLPYDPCREKPVLYSSGEYIHFEPITAKEYKEIAALVREEKYTVKRETTGDGT